MQTIMEPQNQAEPRLRTTLLDTNMTAQAVHDALVAKGWTDHVLPTVRSISNMLNRQEYRLRTVAKTKVSKKTVATAAIFANVRLTNAQVYADPAILRISMDSKATVHVGACRCMSVRIPDAVNPEGGSRSRYGIMTCDRKKKCAWRYSGAGDRTSVRVFRQQ